MDTSAFSAMSGTRVKSDAPYWLPLTNLYRERCTKDDVIWVWNETELWMSKVGGSKPTMRSVPARLGGGVWARAAEGRPSGPRPPRPPG